MEEAFPTLLLPFTVDFISANLIATHSLFIVQTWMKVKEEST